MGYYNTIAPGYDRLHKEEQLAKLKLILDNLMVCEPDSLLDVGCGTAFAADLIKARYVGIDPSFDMLKGKLRVIQGCAELLPFRNDSFDFVISLTAIHNFDDIAKGLMEMRRVCSGRFAFSVLKRSRKAREIREYIHSMFKVERIIDEDKDRIFIGRKSSNPEYIAKYK